MRTRSAYRAAGKRASGTAEGILFLPSLNGTLEDASTLKPFLRGIFSKVSDGRPTAPLSKLVKATASVWLKAGMTYHDMQSLARERKVVANVGVDAFVTFLLGDVVAKGYEKRHALRPSIERQAITRDMAQSAQRVLREVGAAMKATSSVAHAMIRSTPGEGKAAFLTRLGSVEVPKDLERLLPSKMDWGVLLHTLQLVAAYTWDE